MNFSRRRFLGGAAGVVALPLLESLRPRKAWGQTMVPPKRLIIYYLPNGRNPSTWVPSTGGTGFALPSALAPLQPFASQLTMVSGMANMSSFSTVSKPGCDHCRAAGPALTCTPMLNTASALQNGISMDQFLVNALKPSTALPSVQWTAAQPGVADCGAVSAYTQTISWSNPTTPLAPLNSPLDAFNQLFAGSDPGATAAQQALRVAHAKSVLDFVQSDANSLARQMSAADAAKLDEYFTGIRQLETRLTQPANATCTAGNAPLVGLDFSTTVQAFNDLMTLALQCDLTRVMTFMLEFELSYRVYDFLFAGQSTTGHHALSHFSNTTQLNQLIAVETWQTQQVAYLAKKLMSVSEGSGTLLDNVALVALPGMGAGASHDHSNICAAILGSCGGSIKPGSHIQTTQAPLADLHVSLLQAMGVQTKTFGLDGTAPIPGLA